MDMYMMVRTNNDLLKNISQRFDTMGNTVKVLEGKWDMSMDLCKSAEKSLGHHRVRMGADMSNMDRRTTILKADVVKLDNERQSLSERIEGVWDAVHKCAREQKRVEDAFKKYLQDCVLAEQQQKH